MLVKWNHNLYPDSPMPDMDGATEYEKADYLHRLCTQADFGEFYPTEDVVKALGEWRHVFDEYPILDSSMYHVLRARFEWPKLELMPPLPHEKMYWEILDERDGRPLDPCFYCV